MKHAVIPFTICAFALFAAVAPAAAAPAPQTITINVSSAASFAPSEITVHAGQPVALKFIGQSGVHGIASSELGIASTTIMPNSTKTVTFTPSKPGTYVINCSIPCGPDHGKMTLTIKVV